ncbi:hypothetical protein [Thalassobaculum litoreum]|uniref:Uncharacterized protein n=1 Tax=Thalassobaculum litoreum DSM 18839 TaxID=1123362 RepID=A0A8G2BJ99_9PROT|nr:hypothetical protein [Thalassobaculum litoreum]SDF67171.1 hypothetical protein SAMN05660686_02008 [Thalassobaculum litoreum DSM 18839]
MTAAPAGSAVEGTLRPASTVMRLARLGAFFPTRISFLRTMIRRLHGEGAVVRRPVWRIDDRGYGVAVYSLDFGGHPYSLVAFSTELATEDRSDRVIAEAWDTSYVLFDGIPDAADIDRLAAAVPRQEAARYTGRDLVLSRANRSVRLFDHVVDALARGDQPDRTLIAETGYLMRTTAVYGNGKFGIADRARIAGRGGLGGPFQAEMLAVWLIRGFTLDLVEHIARRRGGAQAATLAPGYRRYLGIGNSTGLGMAPFLVNHPLLLHNWIAARETALARVRGIERAAEAEISAFLAGLDRVRAHVRDWRVSDSRQMARIEVLDVELEAVSGWLDAAWLSRLWPWERLMAEAERLSLEGQELLVSLVLEPHGALIDDTADCMASDGEPRLDPTVTVGDLRRALDTDFDWALAIDFSQPAECQRFWYVSEEKSEPRLGERRLEAGAEREMPLDVARRVQALDSDLDDADPAERLVRFLLRHPQHRFAVGRVQLAAGHLYAEIRDNLIGAGCVPVDMLRCKLSFFGAGRFDPKSDRWTRIVLFQGAPGLDDIATADPDGWAFPILARDVAGTGP